MFKVKGITFLCLLSFILIGCQENNLKIKEDVTSVEVHACCKDKERLTEITDQSFINDLVTKLEHADTGTTAIPYFLPPEYKLYFKADDATVYQMGYFAEVGDLNLEGRYWDFNNDRMYGVDDELPVNE